MAWVEPGETLKGCSLQMEDISPSRDRLSFLSLDFTAFYASTFFFKSQWIVYV